LGRGPCSGKSPNRPGHGAPPPRSQTAPEPLAPEPGLTQGQPKAEAVDEPASLAPVTVLRARVPSKAATGAPAQRTRAVSDCTERINRWRVFMGAPFIQAPFPHIAVHLV
jgi:hypothetical protein